MINKIGIFTIITLLLAGCACTTDVKRIEELETRIKTLENNIDVTPANKTASDITSAEIAGAPGATLENTVPETPTKKDIQTTLKNAGFYTGEIDGKFGPGTKKAVEEFQTSQGLSADGKVGPNTWDKLKTYYKSTLTEITQ